MKPGERQLSDFYHDDPVEEVSGTRRNFKGIISLILLIAVGGTYLQTTLAANINLNSGLVVEFGQGVAATTACSGSTSLIVTPISTFQNASGAGAFYFSSVKVSNIPSGCNGKDFIINAYNSSGGSPLAIFNSTSTNAVVWSDGGTFKLGAGTTTGASITSDTGTFTLTFTTPVAAAASVFKLTIQSSNHTEIAVGYSVGQTGPGGGKIFYYSAAGFNCGPNYTDTCNYLEVAPSIWSGAMVWEGEEPDEYQVAEKDTQFAFAINTQSENDIVYVVNNPLVSQVGRGYKNSSAILNQAGNGATTAAGAARAYTGGGKSDWYLPTFSEINLLCQWAKGITPQSATTLCSGNQPPTAPADDSFDLLSAPYSTSSQSSIDDTWYWVMSMSDGSYEDIEKAQSARVRPIRAF
jgi:hypothetical protein